MGSPLTPVEVGVIVVGALDLVLILGGPMIRALRRGGAGQRVRDDGPQRHLEKAGTPTMGGILILGATVVVALLGEWWLSAGLSLRMLVLVAVMTAFGAIGLTDDWRKIRRGRSLGLRARDKLALQVIAAAGFVYALAGERSVGTTASSSSGPLTPAGAAFWLLAIVATSNAVNLADGLDGLAAGLCLLAAGGFAILGLASGQTEVAVLALALGGACLGFLAFNLHPAKVFMGDVGSLALGAAMAAMAAWLNRPLALLGLCLVPFAEELSVIAQVISFQSTGKRLLKMSPLHHHFELSGWPEPRVVLTFWAVALAAAAAVVALSLAGPRA